MNRQLRTLIIETGFAPSTGAVFQKGDGVIDYGIYSKNDSWWRKLEHKAQLDIGLALAAKKMAEDYDVIWAWSEKVGIPLAYMGIKKPIVTVCQHMASPKKRRVLKSLGVTKRWAGMAHFSNADRQFMSGYYGVPESKLIRCMGAPIDRFAPSDGLANTGAIMSLGVSKRDYQTLLSALSGLPGYKTEIYLASRYGDKYLGSQAESIPDWVEIKEWVGDDELAERYRRARFVVLPLVDTTQFSAGASVALEASAAGKAIIATKTKGMSTYVKDGETGLLVEPNNSEALQNAISLLWNNPELARKMGLAGRKYVELEFNPVAINRDIKQFLINIHEKHIASTQHMKI